jgi:hypothetical protein
MGFALELANAGNSGMPDDWEAPSATPRHRRLPRTRRFGLVGVPHVTAAAATTAARWAKAVITTRPALADHRKAF